MSNKISTKVERIFYASHFVFKELKNIKDKHLKKGYTNTRFSYDNVLVRP